jgi:multicomponent Na+:H+ antiporter subunit F
MTEFYLITALLISVFILLMVFRVAFSKNVPERIVALDTINTLIVILMVILGTVQRKSLYIDIGIIYGVISFIGTLYIARYLISEEK